MIWLKRYIITVILANLKADFELFENQLARIRLMNELAIRKMNLWDYCELNGVKWEIIE